MIRLYGLHSIRLMVCLKHVLEPIDPYLLMKSLAEKKCWSGGRNAATVSPLTDAFLCPQRDCNDP